VGGKIGLKARHAWVVWHKNCVDTDEVKLFAQLVLLNWIVPGKHREKKTQQIHPTGDVLDINWYPHGERRKDLRQRPEGK